MCVRLAEAAWASPFLSMVPTVLSWARLSYCHGNAINHFFCDNAPLLQLSCSNTSLLEFWDFVMALAFVLSSFLVTRISYGYIVSAVLRSPLPAASGRLSPRMGLTSPCCSQAMAAPSSSMAGLANHTLWTSIRPSPW